MKKLALTLTATLACVAAFAQGKVNLANNSLHLVYYSTDSSKLVAADAALAGSVATQASGLSVDLFAGTSQASMAKVATTTMAASPGTFGTANITLPFAAGSGQFFQIYVYSTVAGSYDAATAAQNEYFGTSGLFNGTSGGSVTYNNLSATGSPTFSTWANGTQAVSGTVAGAMGAIALTANVPEPTSFALLGLGAASLMIFRRRK